MIVVDKICDRFVDRYSTEVANLRAGDPFDPKTTLAPLSSEGAVKDTRNKIGQAVANDATATEVGPKVPTEKFLHGAIRRVFSAIRAGCRVSLDEEHGGHRAQQQQSDPGRTVREG